MVRTLSPWCGLVVASIALSAAAHAADAPKGKDSKPAAANRFSPLETAFALPKGVTLRPDQQKAYDKLRKEKEPKLKEAMAKVEKAEGDDKTKAAREVINLRETIEKQIKEIVAQPAPESELDNDQNKDHKKHKRHPAVRIRVRN